MRDFLEGEGIDTRFLAVDRLLADAPDLLRGLAAGRFPITFYRRPTVPDWQLQPGDFDPDEIAAAPLLFATGTGLAQSPSRETTLAALSAPHAATTVFDLDWRPYALGRRRCLPRARCEAAGLADVVIGNEDEVAAAPVATTACSCFKRRDRKRGSTVLRRTVSTDVPGFPVEVVNGLGAGDAFAPRSASAARRGLGLCEGVRRGNGRGRARRATARLLRGDADAGRAHAGGMA